MSHVLGKKENFRIGKDVCGFWHGIVEYFRQTLIREENLNFSTSDALHFVLCNRMLSSTVSHILT